MSEENVELVRGMRDAFNRDDVDTVVAAFEEGCEIKEPLEMPDSPATGYRGHDGIRAWMGNLRGVAGAGFRAAALHTEWGRPALRTGVERGRAASGAPLEWMTFAVFEMPGGKIARIRVFLSREEAVASVGLRE